MYPSDVVVPVGHQQLQLEVEVQVVDVDHLQALLPAGQLQVGAAGVVHRPQWVDPVDQDHHEDGRNVELEQAEVGRHCGPEAAAVLSGGGGTSWMSLLNQFLNFFLDW